MPRYRVRLAREASGEWVGSALELPNTWSRGPTRESVLAKLRDEIRFRLELCPCSAVADEFVQIEVASEPESFPAAQRPAAASPSPPAGEKSGWSGARRATTASWRGVAGCPPSPPAAAEESSAIKRQRRHTRWPD